MAENCPKCHKPYLRDGSYSVWTVAIFACGTVVYGDGKIHKESSQCLRNQRAQRDEQLAIARGMIADLIVGEPDCDEGVMRDAQAFADGGKATCSACTAYGEKVTDQRAYGRAEGCGAAIALIKKNGGTVPESVDFVLGGIDALECAKAEGRREIIKVAQRQHDFYGTAEGRTHAGSKMRQLGVGLVLEEIAAQGEQETAK